METKFAIIGGQVAEGKVISRMKWCDSIELEFYSTIDNKQMHRTEHYYPKKILKNDQVFNTRAEAQKALDAIRKAIAEARKKAEAAKNQQALEEAKSTIEAESHEDNPNQK